MPITADIFNKGIAGSNEIENLLMTHPGMAYSLHEIEEELIGPGMNRARHLDVFIAYLTLLGPQISEGKKIECRVVEGIPYFTWCG